VIAGCLLVFAGLVEMIQLWVPGRHARLSDFAVDAAALIFGVAAAGLARLAGIRIS
jgi:VanZ family protein